MNEERRARFNARLRSRLAERLGRFVVVKQSTGQMLEPEVG
jgi:hypothetical protein